VVETLYDLRNIEHCFGGPPVLSIDSWQIGADKVTGIAGPNGSGKSTLLSLLGLVISPTRGEVLLRGGPVQPFDESVRGQIALLPQDSFLLKRSVFRNVAYGLTIQGRRSNVEQRVKEAMRMVGLAPERYGPRPWYALSGGEARRVALAARLALKPRVLLMDEPTISVDDASAQMIKTAALHARRQWGTTLIVTSHDRQWLADICDTILLMFRGRILGTGQQTLVFGPWRLPGDGRATTPLDRQQEFVVDSAPPDFNRSVAAIRADQLRLFAEAPQGAQARWHCLEGLLLQLGLDNETGRIISAVRVGNTMFNAFIPDSSGTKERYEPGQKVRVGYDPGQVVWY
jgi:tungstate transport system ATP-binding protein